MSEAKSEAGKSPPVCIPNPFSESTSKTDLVLLVEDQRLHVSRLVMSLISPVFEAMLTGDYKEKGMEEIPLPDKKYKDMLLFLRCVYPSVLEPITKENLESVLPLAEEYQIPILKVRCETYVLNQFEKENAAYSAKQLIHYLYLADTYQLTTLGDACINKLKHRLCTNDPSSYSTSQAMFNLCSSITTVPAFSGRGRSDNIPSGVVHEDFCIVTDSEYQLLSSDTKIKLLTARLTVVEKNMA